MRWPAALVAVLLVAAACTGGDDQADHSPRPPDEPPTSAIDYTGVSLADVPGRTTTTALVQTGTASILGTVTGPTGLLPGATVRIERLVGGQAIRTDVVTGPDGHYELRSIPGGRYRVRAFLAPALALTTPDVRFIPAAKETTFDLAVTDQRGIVARAAVAPDPPYLGEDVNLAVVVATKSVDPDGIVRSTPVSGLRVELSGLGSWVLRVDRTRSQLQPRETTTTQAVSQSAVAFTDVNGQVRYQLTSAQAGPAGLGLLVSVTVTPTTVEGQPPGLPEQRTDRLDLGVPDCIDPSQVTTAPLETSTTGGGR